MSRIELRSALIAAHRAAIAAALPLLGTAEGRAVKAIRADGDTTQRLDEACESAIIAALSRVPGYRFRIYSEECGYRSVGEGDDYDVLVDPVDNSMLATRRIPVGSVSICVVDPRRRRPIAAIIGRLDDPWAVYADAGGAWLDGKPVRTSTTTDIRQAGLGLWAPSGVRLRSLGASARLSSARFIHGLAGCLEMAYVASGFLDAFVEPIGLPLYEFAAGACLIEAAGGVCSALDGSAIDYCATPTIRQTFVLAANRELHAALREACADDTPLAAESA